ncbi:YitT family protein [Bacteroides heparinolyticus]|uniref:Putative transmembrane protein n=1 Tax=Prevotella heparinolytica TaxID=28113 RepID=A0A3P2A0P1_9BACE|nr:YitT family protein [Bacteroides heparinolyticus]MCF0255609.1 YitT family protein [Bacteroides heparinolyticus]MCI6211910.1 YitT family protein [Bacteroides heparinolyticus]RRD88879.1 YitT family protein [Bacteroides heparinolyticus]VFB13495.1 putative transmembrane protein [Bacteroides heparinolyticus]
MQITKPTKAEVTRELRDYVFITFGLISYALGWAAFLIPYQITTGGTTGIGAIIYYATGFPIQWSYFIINAILMTFAIKILGPKFSIKTTYAIFGLTFLLWFFQLLVNGADGVPPQILGPGQDFMACLIGATMCGIGLGVVFNCNGSTGGTDIIAAIINKYHDVTLGRMVMACDVIIISSCYFIFNDWRRVIFGFVTLFVIGFVLDYIVNSARQSVQFFIFSKEYEKIADRITKETHRGVTVLDGIGWYSKHNVKVLVVLAYKRQSIEIFRMVKDIDPNAFISQSSVIGVYGEGFDRLKVK